MSFLARLQGFSRRDSIIEASRVLELMLLSNVTKDKIGALSHGMKKRVAIAQALMGKPELVLLDEPTAGLDPANARNIRQQVMALAGETTFLISSHNLEELERLCGEVLYLEQGELKAQQLIGQQTTQHANHNTSSQVGEASQQQVLSYLSLRLTAKNSVLEAKIKQLEGVSNVDCQQGDEFVIAYNYQQNPILDQHLLLLLAESKISYRQITHGQSLEDQLFRK